ncbi:hypothetical protein GPA25_07215 [Aromatoleum diolicum]|uniref:Uncharacterized protein n=1 Tax=Aromatoleum diolicum TaxID=75796 RepID=A0ABX1Q9A7_9RHOO|nr:hypothetical protein [Aromatoleum diolicum]
MRSSAAAVALAALALVPGAASADERPCEAPGKLVPIAGKILNNSLGPGDTLGTLQGTLAGSKKLKCGIHGKAFLNPDGSFGGFTHSVVCDDTLQAENAVDSIHSQVISISRFDGLPNFGSCGIPGMDLQYGSFREISDPQAGRGQFSPTGGGRLYIEGTINCAGAVDMSFTGHVCLVR